MTLKKAVFLFILIIAGPVAQAQTVQEVIAGYVRFIGGEERWKKVQSIVCSGTYNYGGMEFPFQSFSKAPDLYKYIVPYNGKYYAQAYDGKQGWKIDVFNNETKKTLLTGKAAIAMANEADVELESPFVRYQSKGHKALLEGMDTVNGTKCFKVKLTTKNGESATCYFSSSDYALLKKVAISRNAELKNSLLDTYYAGYREIDGIKIPFVTTSKTDDQTILVITVKEAKLNTAVPESEFKF